MNVLVFTTVFPNPRQPLRGSFVRDRVRHTSRLARIRVVAPVAWHQRGRVPRHVELDGLSVEHPTFVYVPGVFKALDPFFLFLSSLIAVARLFRAQRVDVIDAHFGYPDGVAAVMLGRWFGCLVTVTLRGSELVLVRSRARRRLMGWALRSASRVVAVSSELARLAVELGAAPDRVTVIPNGVDTERFRPGDRSEDRHALGLSEGDPLIVMVGHLVPLKGFHRVVAALGDNTSSVPANTHLVIVGGPSYGSGSYPVRLRRLAESQRLSDRVRFAGAQPPDQVARWLRAADLFVLASDREGCPNVVLEALASGTPVVAAAVGEVPALVPEWAGIVFDPDDPVALQHAMGRALRQRWDRRRIRAYAVSHTWVRVAERVHAEWMLATGSAEPVALRSAS